MTEVQDQILSLGTGQEVVNKEVFDKYFQFTKDNFTGEQRDLIDAYIAVETLGAVLAKALGIPRIQATVEDDNEPV
ncbi:hypothetical protein phiK7A1_124 [Pseudomonas phage phiK7A1]|uniref:Uncharacterized protein n=1 Tax=Pseudomonas phage phiK7A1 TaxID=2759194 RepID=A0A7H0XFX2_9CAUD|nr:hypothetical protein phiK7A1_124 [Pseudomonas phage phiK7A1]